MTGPVPPQDIVKRHVSTDDPEAVFTEVEACLAALTGHAVAPAERGRARARLEQVGDRFKGSPKQVSALIHDLAALDPPQQAWRTAALISAWAQRSAD